MDKPIQDAVTLTEKFQENINKLLSEPRYNGNLVNINANIRLIKNKLAFMGGKLTSMGRQGVQATAGRKHGPLRKFMGKDLPDVENRVASTAEVKRSLTPAEDEKVIFKKKVAKLMSEISKFPPQSIITNYRRPEDAMIVRGVAYKLGIEGVDEHTEITIPFITQITDAIAKKKADGSLQAAIDQASLEDKTIKETGDPGGDAKTDERSQILTAEDIAADQWLQKKGAQPGDKLIWDKNRHKKIIPAKAPGDETPPAKTE